MICYRSRERAQIVVRLAELYVIQGGLLAKFEYCGQQHLFQQGIHYCVHHYVSSLAFTPLAEGHCTAANKLLRKSCLR